MLKYYLGATSIKDLASMPSRTLTGWAFGSLSSVSDVASSIDMGTIGRSTSTPCERMESRKMASIAPWCRVI